MEMLYSKRSGEGKTIVFIHGSSQSMVAWDRLVMEPVLALYSLLRVDLPGHGQSFWSEDPQRDYSLKGMAVHLEGFLGAIEEDFVVVTNSLAGNLVAEIIFRLKKCKGLFLTGPSVIGHQFSVSEIAQPNPYFGVTFSADPEKEELEGLAGTLVADPSVSLKLKVIEMFRNTDPKVRLQLGVSIGSGDWGEEVDNLEKLSYPVAVVYGALEQVIFPDYLEGTKIDMWRDKVIKIPGAGHCCHLDKPAVLATLIHEYASTQFLD